MAVCPTCGHSSELGPDQLLEVLRNDSERWVYLGQDKLWYITSGPEHIAPGAVEELVRRRAINSRYSNIPHEAYHVGRTWDYERTMAARKKHGKSAPDYFVGDP